MRKYIACITIGQLIGQSILAQVPANYNADNESFGMLPMLQYAFQQLNSKSMEALDKKVNYKGSPYVIRTFVKGRIYSGDGLEGEAYLRYDGYNDEVQLKSSVEDSIILKLTQNDDIYCVLGREKVFFKEYYDKNDEVNQGHLFQLAEIDEMVLFERRRKIYKEGKEATTSFELPVANRFVLERQLYCSNKEDGKIKFFKPSKKSLLNLLASEDKEKNNKMKSFLSKSRLNLKDPKDVVQVFYYYNTL
nr:hypothetical protein [Allomuricauda sp.]